MNLKVSQLSVAGVILSGTALHAVADTSTNSFQRPAWLTEASVSVKEGYDNNIFQSDANVPNTVPAGYTAAVKDKASWVTTVSPKVDVNLASLLGDQKTLQVLSLAYAPDFAIYHDLDSESYDAQRFLTTVKAKTGAISLNADNSFTYVNGSDQGPVFPGGYLSSFATVTARERREQILDRGNFSVQIDHGDWFVRPTAALLYQDMLTAKLNMVGYQNYVDRYDVNGGGDVGYRIASPLALTLGYRYGHQQQELLAFTPYSSSSDYQRVLLGMEGNVWNWLAVKLQGGPDFRNYVGNAPVNDKDPVKYYGEAQITAKITANDTLTFKYKQWQWVSTLGKTPYFDSTYDLSYHRKLTSKLGLDLGGRVLNWDYTSGNLSTCRRNDIEYTVSANLGYEINSHVCINAGCAFNWGRNLEDGVTLVADREFDQQLFSLGAQFKF